MSDAFLPLNIGQFFGVVAAAKIGAECALIMIADHFPYFFVAMSAANLIDALVFAFKDYQSRLPPPIRQPVSSELGDSCEGAACLNR